MCVYMYVWVCARRQRAGGLLSSSRHLAGPAGRPNAYTRTSTFLRMLSYFLFVVSGGGGLLVSPPRTKLSKMDLIIQLRYYHDVHVLTTPHNRGRANVGE
eukprot:GHVU01158647.1.p2 GENE.GHVU01158647.1~~GHVU01158647.1.p2  ORF type:complete len:100 (+),score=3.13 GHVU01158647.1:298-597(+)